jgi:raffinose/stachyose/melibiose transport system substrate-binding protein
MNKKRMRVGTLLLLVLALAGSGATVSHSSTTSKAGGIKYHQISWLISRTPNSSVVTIITGLAAKFGKTHPGFSLKLITTPDRPSYLQKYETLAAANQLPELFDTDATPFTRELAKRGQLVDVTSLLKQLGLYNKYRPLALDYQRFDDGSLYMIPFEFEMEYFFYNKALFKQAGVSVPKTLGDLPKICGPLRSKGIIPITVDGQDGWPLERYMAYYPFRQAGPTYLTNLKQGKVKLSGSVGTTAAQWLSDLGHNNCFQEGFSSQGYTDAENLFTSGKAAVYQIGTWELPTLGSSSLPANVRNNISFFTLPTVPGAVTAKNDFGVVSGIGTALSAKKFDPSVKAFMAYLLNHYPALLAQSGHMTPVEGYNAVIPHDATALYARALAPAAHLGDKIAFPWDTQLDPTTNTLLQQDLVQLVQGGMSPSSFTKTIDDSIAQNAPKYFEK